ncbi:uncharacterized protein gtsf1 [Diretmus argenteus]
MRFTKAHANSSSAPPLNWFQCRQEKHLHSRKRLHRVQDEGDDCDPNKLLQCPYDKSHQIRACRFPYHLIKCKKNHLELANQLRTCPYNARHLIPKAELARHIATCVDNRPITGGGDEEKFQLQVPVGGEHHQP